MTFLSSVYLVLALFSTLFSFLNVVYAQSGFINIDCGKPSKYTYKDTVTGLTYTSDSEYINDVGVIHKVSFRYRKSSPYSHSDDLRSFPKGKRNCYTLKTLAKGSKYLIRGFFLYGNYDGLNRLPKFDLHLDVNYWDTIKINDSSTYHYSEIFVVASSSMMSLCLINTDSGIPFVSAIDVRLLPRHTINEVNTSQSLVTSNRLDFGASYTTHLRYKNDAADRLWSPYNKPEWSKISTSSIISGTTYYRLPQDVMATAATPTTGSNLNFSLTLTKTVPPPKYHMTLHFAELQSLTKNQSRIMTIYLNDNVWADNVTIKGGNFKAYTIYTGHPKTHTKLEFSIRKEGNSTLPPLINAMQVLMVRPLTVKATYDADAQAILDIKEYYMIRKDWMGDPCSPKDYRWDDLSCTYNDLKAPRIVSLYLSSSGLSGVIHNSFGLLAKLEILDLSNNNLSGMIPSFLGNLQHLRYLNLKGNKLDRTIPKTLKDKVSSGKLILRVDEDGTMSNSPSKVAIILVVFVFFGVVLL